MKEMYKHGLATTEELVRSILSDVLAALPTGAANLIKVQASNGDTILRIVPTRLGAADISVHIACPNLVDFGFGKSVGCWEIWSEDGNSRSFEGVLRRYCDAVTEGSVEQGTGFLCKKYRMTVDGKQMGIRSFFHFHLFSKMTRYLSYV